MMVNNVLIGNVTKDSQPRVRWWLELNHKDGKLYLRAQADDLDQAILEIDFSDNIAVIRTLPLYSKALLRILCDTDSEGTRVRIEENEE